MTRHTVFAFAKIAMFVLLTGSAFILNEARAQVGSITGYPPFATIQGNVDAINTVNLNVHLEIPVVHRTGRKLPFDYNLSYDSTVYYPSGGRWTPVPNWGWRGITEAFLGYQTATLTVVNGNVYVISNLTFHDSRGTVHTFGNLEACSSSSVCPTSATGFATDGSGLLEWLTCNSSGCYGDVFTPSGVLIDAPVFFGQNVPTNGPGSLFVDSNNVIVSVSNGTVTFKDTVFNSSQQDTALTVSGTNPVNYVYTGPHTTPETVAVNYGSYSIQTNFGCSGIAEYTASNVALVSSINLADGTKYTFSYEKNGAYYTGRITQIGLPTGGVIAYQYSGGSNGIDCADGTTAGLARTTPDGKWTYTRSNTTSVTYKATGITTTILDPAPNKTVYTFSDGLETQRQVYAGSSTLLDTVLTCYNGNFANCATASIAGQVTRKDAYHTPSGTGAKTSLSETFYNSIGLVTQGNEFDYGINTGAAPTGTPIKAILSTYAPAPGMGVNNRLACIQVTAGSSPAPSSCSTPSSTTKALTTYTGYDGYGNVGAVSRWVSGTGSSVRWLSRSYTYNSFGNVATLADVNGAQTAYSYNNCAQTNYLGLLSGINEPLGLSRSWTWDCNGGVETNIVDENGQPTQYGYVSQGGTPDPLWRVSSTTDPLSNVGWRSYTAPSGSAGATAEGALTFTTSTGSATVDVLSTMDSLGRPIYTQQRQAPSSSAFDSVQNTYAWNGTGYVTARSVPYSGTAHQAPPSGTAVTTTQYDAMGRVSSIVDGAGGTMSYSYAANDVSRTVGPTQLFARQTEYDALSRITSVCEESSTLPAVGSCSQVSSQPKGYFTKYSYDSPANSMTVTQNATGTAQTRRNQYDGISRLVSETNPEWGPGTVTYTYDSDSSGTCPGTYNGDLVKKVDSAGNVTCYTYDKLHRRLSITVVSGPNASATPNKCFVYDAALDGNSVANTKGRMAEAYTTTSACSSTTLPATSTDEAFGYTARGEISDLYESTPNSGGYYHIPVTYWPNGLIETFGPFLTEDKVGFTPDGEGRAGSVYDFTLGESTAPISYYTSSGQPTGNQPTQIQASCYKGTCYPITYQYDPKTLRMTQYSAALAGGTISGSLTWNPNGALRQLVIVDPFNSADAETCNYGADDLNRVSSVNCVNGSTNIWSQNFSYDAFGNITKSGSISWIPGYNTTTNQYALGGSSYDANGNLTNDTFNKYTWDANGKPLTTVYPNGQTWAFVYDAFGHMVESSVNGTYQGSYIKLGRYRLSAHGQTAAYSEYPLPGGVVNSVNGGASGVQLSDWLGSIRAFYSYTGGYSSSWAHAPFGETYSTNDPYGTGFAGQSAYSSLGSDGNPSNTIYFFPERWYRSSQGRWLSPDPAGLAAVNFGNPQTFNRYAYALNNPLALVDPTGLDTNGCDVPVYDSEDGSGDGGGDDGGGDCGGGGGGGGGGGDDGGGDVGNPTDPGDPGDPGNPSDPSDPSNPDDPNQPDPNNPDDPSGPIDQGCGDTNPGSGSDDGGTADVRLGIFAGDAGLGIFRLGAFGKHLRYNPMADQGSGGSSQNGQPNQCSKQQQQQQQQQQQCASIQQTYTQQANVTNLKWMSRFWGSVAIGGIVGGFSVAAGAGATALLYDEDNKELADLYNTSSSQWSAAGCSGTLQNAFPK